jgi:hypothetical protein
MGFYASEGRRFRVAILERSDEAAAQDVMKTLKKIEGATETKGLMPTLNLPWRGANETTKTEWIFARQGRLVIGVGDEELALLQLTAAQAKEKSLPRDKKLERLKKLAETLRDRNTAPAAQAPERPLPASDAPSKK